eukprot:CAMPEP_0184697838 /NCGR_PEP_ID=MMETSP0313-20130426/4653_1 /TAXON_ID=2792 /ORGANISM="Porphyridium aerugineum, Strain SAG 1380-2" /LENGTH=296 /DNA_ID=CAMNT_0027156677 /DNA_START=594 /DNA_END=1484 /DNA_ORIENTATION=+
MNTYDDYIFADLSGTADLQMHLGDDYFLGFDNLGGVGIEAHIPQPNVGETPEDLLDAQLFEPSFHHDVQEPLAPLPAAASASASASTTHATTQGHVQAPGSAPVITGPSSVWGTSAILGLPHDAPLTSKQVMLDGSLVSDIHVEQCNSNEDDTSESDLCVPPSAGLILPLQQSPARLAARDDLFVKPRPTDRLERSLLDPKPMLRKVMSSSSFSSKMSSYSLEMDPKQARMRAVERLRDKRAKRSSLRKVRYDVRQKIASSRPRVHGRFVKVASEPCLENLMLNCKDDSLEEDDSC